MISQSSHGFHSADLEVVRKQLTHTFGIQVAAWLTNLEMLGLVKQRTSSIGWGRGKPPTQQISTRFKLNGDLKSYSTGTADPLCCGHGWQIPLFTRAVQLGASDEWHNQALGEVPG